jgi:hypothetical protein
MKVAAKQRHGLHQNLEALLCVSAVQETQPKIV